MQQIPSADEDREMQLKAVQKASKWTLICDFIYLVK